MKVKICGLTDIAGANCAAGAGADFVGLIFAPSKRQLTPDKAREIVEVIRKLDPRPAIVGVFVNLPVKQVNETVEFCGLDKVQLSGIESWEYCRQIERPLIKAIHVTPNSKTHEILKEIEEGYNLFTADRMTFLLDTFAPGGGGSGQIFDWKLAGEVAERFPVIVACGLNPQNISELVRQVKPWGVDVSSGVETEGRKDALKIKSFIQTARDTTK